VDDLPTCLLLPLVDVSFDKFRPWPGQHQHNQIVEKVDQSHCANQHEPEMEEKIEPEWRRVNEEKQR
jgi:hypothetical protein